MTFSRRDVLAGGLLFEVPPKVVDDPFKPEREFMSRYQPVRAIEKQE